MKYLLASLLVAIALFNEGTGRHHSGSLRLPIQPPIVGGNTVPIEQFPYQVQYEYQGSFWCGASIISDIWILSTASCTSIAQASSVIIRVGSATKGEGDEHQAAALYNFEKYNADLLTYDVGLIQLQTKIIFSLQARPVKLANTEIQAGESAYVSGWGNMEDDPYYDSYATDLQALLVPVVSRKLCKAIYNTKVIDESHICAGLNGNNFCQGDFGGPLVKDGVQVGIVSHTVGCGQDGIPGVYSNVAEPSTRDWIFSQTGV